MPGSAQDDFWPSTSQAWTLQEKRQYIERRRQERAEREQKEKDAARFAERRVRASTLATRAPSAAVTPLQQTLPAAPDGGIATTTTMAGNLNLDALLVRLLGQVYPPEGPIKEIRDLVLLLPAAINAERNSHDVKFTELNKKTKKDVNADAQKEIHSLKSANGSLKADVRRLEQKMKNQGLKDSAGETQKEINNLKSINGGLKAEILKLDQRLIDAQAELARSRNANQIAQASSVYGYANCNAGQAVRSQLTSRPNVNLQSRLQAGYRSPPRDPRPQLYSSSPDGFFFHSYPATNPPSVFQGNEKQMIHPSRMGQMDEASVSRIESPTVASGSIATANRSTTAPLAVAANSLHTLPAAGDRPAAYQAFNSMPARTGLPSEQWKERFAYLFDRKSSQGPQPASSNETSKVPAAPTQDPRLAGRANAAPNTKKRAASPPTDEEMAKKVKTEDAAEEQPIHGNATPDNEIANDGQAADSGHTNVELLNEDIEKLQEQYVQAKHRRAASQASITNTDADNGTEQAATTSAGVLSEQQERRDSVISAGGSEATKLQGRQPVCTHCRFSKLECDQKSPCQHCEQRDGECVYLTCEYGKDCQWATCWYSHDTAKKELGGQLPDGATVHQATSA